ncbi:hypothetical protein KAFR_0B01410 [Kazachstania africana CBS 2517]|uniref:HTH APSES-type domain-containing protein n=1 Tax=Kazachstania africana (strain ATCC 22294 / BCRC 22015 / CBS 2517 / CECT 1963 / NBRC 1671 / NRRL Y-8276) TaxID=1071382 RepID=H2APZ0_KAZAF|nr:hypothetical protein KAFR_0B01410 [Kazachstania africana CBS 2517]CCF56440.1 hypothetical protein KAFR_0B01410 [Kazachstania africana CBS 2517]
MLANTNINIPNYTMNHIGLTNPSTQNMEARSTRSLSMNNQITPTGLGISMGPSNLQAQQDVSNHRSSNGGSISYQFENPQDQWRFQSQIPQQVQLSTALPTIQDHPSIRSQASAPYYYYYYGAAPVLQQQQQQQQPLPNDPYRNQQYYYNTGYPNQYQMQPAVLTQGNHPALHPGEFARKSFSVPSQLDAFSSRPLLPISKLGDYNTSTKQYLKPRMITTMWEDEKTLCYQVEANGVSVVRRADNDMINGTKLLNVTKMTRGRRDGILRGEKVRNVVKIGSMHLKGVWIPFERAYLIAQREKIVDLLYPLFVKDIKGLLKQTSSSSMPTNHSLEPSLPFNENETSNTHYATSSPQIMPGSTDSNSYSPKNTLHAEPFPQPQRLQQHSLIQDYTPPASAPPLANLTENSIRLPRISTSSEPSDIPSGNHGEVLIKHASLSSSSDNSSVLSSYHRISSIVSPEPSPVSSQVDQGKQDHDNGETMQNSVKKSDLLNIMNNSELNKANAEINTEPAKSAANVIEQVASN